MNARKMTIEEEKQLFQLIKEIGLYNVMKGLQDICERLREKVGEMGHDPAVWVQAANMAEKFADNLHPYMGKFQLETTNPLDNNLCNL